MATLDVVLSFLLGVYMRKKSISYLWNAKGFKRFLINCSCKTRARQHADRKTIKVKSIK